MNESQPTTQIYIDNLIDACDEHCPANSQIEQWAKHCLDSQINENYELSIQIVDSKTMQDFNRQYRDKDKPTNVLSFAADLPDIPLPFRLLGDIIICADVVNREANEQNKLADAHWAHMVIHGCLHLLGFDHIEEQDAQHMETLETQLLNALGYACPYDIDDTASNF